MSKNTSGLKYIGHNCLNHTENVTLYALLHLNMKTICYLLCRNSHTELFYKDNVLKNFAELRRFYIVNLMNSWN